MLYRACVKEWVSVSEPQDLSGNIHLPHFHLKMKTGPFFLNIMVSDNEQHTDTCQAYYTPCPKKIVPFFFIFFSLGAQCVESGVSCTDCY